MKRMLVLSCLFLTLSATTVASADEAHDKSAAKVAAPKDRGAVSRGSVSIGGKTIGYTATAGTLILKNKDEKPIADMSYALDTDVSHVFITENEINFLAFPSIPDAMVVFGSGYGFEALGSAEWLRDRQLHYWGDIDTHGFAILDQLRSRFAHVRSFLMDRDTLKAGQAMWVCEEKPLSHDLSRLTVEELALYNDLRDQRFGRNLRLEREMIGFERVQEVITQIVATNGPLPMERIG